MNVMLVSTKMITSPIVCLVFNVDTCQTPWISPHSSSVVLARRAECQMKSHGGNGLAGGQHSTPLWAETNRNRVSLRRSAQFLTTGERSLVEVQRFGDT